MESLLSRMNIDTRDPSATDTDSDKRTVAGLDGAAPLMPFSTLTTIVADVKDKLELLSLAPVPASAPPAPPSPLSLDGPSQINTEPAPGRRQIAYLHLGSPAAMLISTTRRDALAEAGAKNRRPFQLLFSCMVAHGDVVLVRCGEESEYKVSGMLVPQRLNGKVSRSPSATLTPFVPSLLVS